MKKFIIYLVLLATLSVTVYFGYSYHSLNQDISLYRKKYGHTRISGTSGNKLERYYFYDIALDYRFNDHGLPVYRVDRGDYIHPTQLIHLGLEKVSLYHENRDPKTLAAAIQYGDYLLTLLEIKKYQEIEYALLPIYFRNRYFPFSGESWISALTQGQAISLFLRLHALTGKEEYFQAAGKIFQSYRVPLEAGGVVVQRPGFVWTEEVVSRPPTHILNGNILSLLGVYDYWLVTGDENAQRLFQEGVHSLAASLERYSLGSWSYYDDPDSGWSGLADGSYQVLHPILLDVLYQLTGEPAFQHYAHRWRQGQESFWSKLTYVALKNYYRFRRLWHRQSYQTIPYE